MFLKPKSLAYVLKTETVGMWFSELRPLAYVFETEIVDGVPTFVVWASDRGRKPSASSVPEDDLPLYHIPCT
jgi:hypothetical protein